MASSQVNQQLDAIERHLTELEGTIRILLTSRLLRDGHASSWREAVAIARDRERLLALYPEASR